MWAAIGATVLVFSAAIIDSLSRLRSGGYVPGSDNAAIEYVTRQVGSRSVLVGVYSRFGWHHPGPALFYLFAGPYRILGSSSAALPLTALLLNAGCIIGIVLVLYRRAGVAIMLWGLVVIAIYLRWLDPGFLRSDWNPDVPLLPFTLLVLLCWTLMNGDRWALPLVVGIGSFCVQSHVSYALGVGAVFSATAVALAARAICRRRRIGAWKVSWRVWRGPAGAALAITALMWAAPIYDEVRGHPGNFTQILDYFQKTRPDWTYTQGWREVLTSTGRLPSWISGQHPTSQYLAPGQLPTWTGYLAIGALVLAVGRVVARPKVQQAQLLGLAAVVIGAAVAAVRRVVGPLYPYLVEWTWAAGVLLWIAVGFVFVEAMRARLVPNKAARGTAYAALSAFVIVGAITGVKTAQVMPGDMPAVRQLSAAVQRWLAARPRGTVRVDFANTIKPSLLGTTVAGDGLFLALDRGGVDVQVPRSAELVFGPTSSNHVDQARWLVVIAFDAGRSPPPAEGMQLLDTSGGYQVYAGAIRR